MDWEAEEASAASALALEQEPASALVLLQGAMLPVAVEDSALWGLSGSREQCGTVEAER